MSKLLTPLIDNYVNSYVKSTSRRNHSNLSQKMINYREMLKQDPVSRYCVELIFLYMFSALGDYRHTKAKIRKDILESIAYSKGSWKETLKRISSVFWYGFSWSEVATDTTNLNRKKLAEIRTLDPSKLIFVGDGEIEKVIYVGSKDIEIDYNTGIHLVSGTDLSFDYNYGLGRCESVYPYWELHQIISPILAVAVQRQANPILVKKTNTSDDVVLIDQSSGLSFIDEMGEPILVKKGWDAIRQLESLGSAGITAIDNEDELFQLEPKLAGDFLMSVIKFCEQYRMLGFLIPSTLGSFSGSGVGDTSLAKTHMEIFEKMVISSLEFVMGEILEQLIRPLIIYNFGEQSEYGSFLIDSGNPDALKISELIISAIDKKVFTANDVEAVNKIRENFGLDPITFEYFPVEQPQPVS